MDSKHNTNPGFTLLELMLVISIIAIISMISFTSFMNLKRTQEYSDGIRIIDSIIAEASSRALANEIEEIGKRLDSDKALDFGIYIGYDKPCLDRFCTTNTNKYITLFLNTFNPNQFSYDPEDKVLNNYKLPGNMRFWPDESYEIGTEGGLVMFFTPPKSRIELYHQDFDPEAPSGSGTYIDSKKATFTVSSEPGNNPRRANQYKIYTGTSTPFSKRLD